MERVTVVGAGVMGSALAIHLGRKNDLNVRLWGTKWDAKTIEQLKAQRFHQKLNEHMPDKVKLFYDNQLEQAMENTNIVVIAVISAGIRDTVAKIAPYLKENSIIVNITKGIEGETGLTISQVIQDALPDNLKQKVSIVKLGGPIRANELSWGKYTWGVFASKDLKAAELCQQVFKTPNFRADVSQDILGVDLCAALKNTYAISIGMCEGLQGDVDNPKAGLMAQGAVEMAKIVESVGGRADTVLGSAGVGDYYVTSQGGRNRTLGKLLGQGKTFEQAIKDMNNATVEGVPAAKSGYNLIKKLEAAEKISLKDLPLFEAIYSVLYEGREVKTAFKKLWANS